MTKIGRFAVTSARKIAANRANARRSTGPRTAAGRARASQNAVRHGLSTSVTTDPKLKPAAEVLARRIMEEGGSPQHAWTIAEATVEIWRVRHRRHEVIQSAPRLRDRHFPKGWSKCLHLMARFQTCFFKRGEIDRALEFMQAYREIMRSWEETPEERQVRKEIEILPELRRLDRYERRALSRRKRAIRALDAARVAGPHSDGHEPVTEPASNGKAA